MWLNRIPSFQLVVFCFILLDSLSFYHGTKVSKSSNHGQKSVKVVLNSKWQQTPLYLEVAEFLSEENPIYFWSFIDMYHSEVETMNQHFNMTQQMQYEISIRLASQLLRSESKLSILKFSISLRSYSPTVAIFHQTMNDLVGHHHDQLSQCDWFVELSQPEDIHSLDGFSRFNCDLKQTQQSISSLITGLVSKSFPLIHPLLYSVDHIYPRQCGPRQPTVILYSNINSPQFMEVHRYLLKVTNENNLRYVLRYWYPVMDEHSKVALSGYGVELAIKSTEYKAQDDTRVRGEASNSSHLTEHEKPDEIGGFIFSNLKRSYPNMDSEKLENFHNYLIDTDKEIATLKAWELQEISLQAVTKVLSVQKEEALKMLKDISQNFPSVARSLVKINVDSDLKKEIVKNQYLFMQSLSLGTSDTAVFINGLYHDIDSVDVFTLFDLVKQEFSITNRLHNLLNGDSDRIKKFIKLDINMEKQDFQVDIRDGAIQYINDIESDRMYKNWPSSLHEMLRPSYPGMLRNVRRNMYHLVLILDPSKRETFEVLRMAESFYIHKAPVRIGIVFAVERDPEATGYTDAGIACLEAFNYLSQEKTPYDGLSFLTDVIAYASNKGGSNNLEPNDVVNHFKSKHKNVNLDDIFGADSAYDTGRQLAWEFIHRIGLGTTFPKALMNGVMLKDSHLNSDYFEEAVLTEIMKQTPTLQKAIYKNELQEDDDILDWMMNKNTVMPRLNRIILGLDTKTSGQKDKYIDFTGTALKLKKDSQLDFASMNINDLQATMASQVKYITMNSKKDSYNPVTVWIATNFLQPSSRQMLSSALQHLKVNSRSMRLALIFSDWNVVDRVLDAAVVSITNQQLLMGFLQKFILYLEQNPHIFDRSDEELFGNVFKFAPENFQSAFNERFQLTSSKELDIVQLHQAFVNRVLQQSDDISLILNGKIYRVPTSEAFTVEDFSLMEKFVSNLVTDKVVELLSENEKSSGSRKCSDLILKLSSALLSKSQTKTRYDVNNINEDHSVLVLEPKHPDEPSIELIAILDPLTRGAQKITPIIETFYEVFNARVKVYFNAVDKHSDMPLKNYYRLVLQSEPHFDSKTGKIQSPVAKFNSMPKTPLFTLGMSVPENWMVEAVDAVYDLDNIHLQQVESSIVSAVFELEHLLVEGHCFEQSTGSPPRGLQFTLGTWNNPVIVDTIVMANLGYFQLKANPGIWLLRLRQGRSDDIYTIVSHDGTDQTVNSTEVIPVVSNFRSYVVKIKVNKKPGKQNEELLYDSDNDNEADNSLWGSFSWSSDSGSDKKKKKQAKKDQDDDEDSKRINIFSLATGHLYERLLRIMIKSVLTNTKTLTKFWFLKNYLSPQFKNVLPFMAKKYKFEYELVQYKWPRWLHQQTEKQRIIWGYKILFLDVLFPLDVKKIIFVDADQVVRADLKELRDLDLEGAPYGYTPFCDSRKEMDGFRFWKQGYWATHLHGRKYHISALYVVDLQKFRRIAAGDRLRGQYQGLSQDPNSLSNLDQDLPNNMIHQVAIKSLPQEWLWCETWCDDDSKKKAKTIDLCNNPKTKEPKLTGARRIISEWESYDNELQQMMDEFSNLSKTKKVEKHHPLEKDEFSAPPPPSIIIGSDAKRDEL
ncbi:hypothetical protein RDWZM_004568 [Blomia tropicalis]|uniref:UDP-glucose:glycoprotein glucosyltransferase n=1 Tax=Blomia tropicalis TaxID=40697 RepID=A0A9Q0RMQ1_BLOTA|nr:hypothetical protein RDWZM_004568 [Blomia tropicalis]